MSKFLAKLFFAPVLFISYVLENALRGGYKDNSRTTK